MQIGSCCKGSGTPGCSEGGRGASTRTCAMAHLQRSPREGEQTPTSHLVQPLTLSAQTRVLTRTVRRKSSSTFLGMMLPTGTRIPITKSSQKTLQHTSDAPWPRWPIKPVHRVVCSVPRCLFAVYITHTRDANVQETLYGDVFRGHLPPSAVDL